MVVMRFLLLVTLCVMSSVSLSLTTMPNGLEDSEKMLDYLKQERTDLLKANQDTTLPRSSPDQTNVLRRIKQNDALLSLVRAKIDSLESFLLTQRKQQKTLVAKIKKTTLIPAQKPDDPALKAEISQLEAMNEINNQTITLIIENLALAHRYETLLLTTQKQLAEWDVQTRGVRHLESLQQQINLFRQDRSALYRKNVTLQHEKKSTVDFNQTYIDDLKLQLNNQYIAFINYQITVLELQIKLVKAEDLFLKQFDIKTILSSIDLYKEAMAQLNDIKQSLSTLLTLLNEEQQYALDNDLKQRIMALKNKVEQFLTKETLHEKQLAKQLALKQDELKQQLSVRQTLAGYQVNSWQTFKIELLHIPPQVTVYAHTLMMSLKDGYARQGIWQKLFLWLSMVSIVVMAVVVNKPLRRVTQDKARSRLSAHLYDGVLLLLARNITQLTLLAVMLTAFMFLRIPFATYHLLIDLIAVWFVFRNLIIIAQIILLRRERDASDKDVRFFYRLKWLLLAGGWTTALMVLSQGLPLSMLIRDILTRLFMLFIFALSIVMWASKDIFPLLLRPAIKTKKRYLRKAISLLFVLLPITLFTTAIIGLVGYMNLAWSMSRYQAYLVLVMTGYVLARGLLSDALELISEWMVSSLRSGWLWVEVFLKPLDTIIHLVLFLASVIFLFQLFGVYTEMPVLTWLKHLGQYELIGVSGVHITLVSVLEFFIVVSIFVWAAKWTREFCYRWLYRDSRDEGVRNSLSVFTQYAVILLGSYITLRVLGLDFSGMSMVIGGLAVGMGFGLRDFASNIIGGIMLLIERPVREGDLITVGEHEGRVAHIGIRSMRVSSWDNTEILIPNAETFNKPFINWTHQDSVVRTAVPIKVSREDDPTLIQSLIFEVLAIIPEILDEPPQQVLLKQIDEALINFEVRYYIDVRLHTRFEIRSKFLFALMAQFKAAGIRPPIPPLSIEIKESKSDYVIRKKTTED